VHLHATVPTAACPQCGTAGSRVSNVNYLGSPSSSVLSCTIQRSNSLSIGDESGLSHHRVFSMVELSTEDDGEPDKWLTSISRVQQLRESGMNWCYGYCIDFVLGVVSRE
jgi:hypothetical protein